MQAGELRITEETDGGRRTLVLEGELDLITAPDLERKVSELCALLPAEIVLDVRELLFLDSTGFEALLAAKASCRAKGIGFAMTKGPGAVEHVFGVSGVLKKLPFV